MLAQQLISKLLATYCILLVLFVLVFALAFLPFFLLIAIFLIIMPLLLICILALPSHSGNQYERSAAVADSRRSAVRPFRFLLQFFFFFYCTRLDRPLPLLARLQSPFTTSFSLFLSQARISCRRSACLHLHAFTSCQTAIHTYVHTYAFASAACLCHLLLIFTANLQTHWPIGCLSVRPSVSNEHCIHNDLLLEKFAIAFRYAGLTALTHIHARRGRL